MSSFCKCKSYSHFFSKSISIYAILNDQSFNDTLTKDIVSFEQLGPVILKKKILFETMDLTTFEYGICIVHLQRPRLQNNWLLYIALMYSNGFVCPDGTFSWCGHFIYLFIYLFIYFSWEENNCETLMVDNNGELYLISKVEFTY